MQRFRSPQVKAVRSSSERSRGEKVRKANGESLEVASFQNPAGPAWIKENHACIAPSTPKMRRFLKACRLHTVTYLPKECLSWTWYRKMVAVFIGKRSSICCTATHFR
jgi:hypothetical protein